jgi:hypothetical protein
MTVACRLALVMALVVVTVGCSGEDVTPSASAAAPGPVRRSAAAAPGDTGVVIVTVTFYAGRDNSPPGSNEIAHPNGRHAVAGGTGTYEDPTTLATDPRELPVGSLVYYAPLQRYFVMEDDCETCIAEWGADRTAHLDLWVSASNDPAVLPCEEALTPAGPVPVEVNPPPGRTVDPRPLFDDGRCWPDT